MKRIGVMITAKNLSANRFGHYYYCSPSESHLTSWHGRETMSCNHHLIMITNRRHYSICLSLHLLLHCWLYVFQPQHSLQISSFFWVEYRLYRARIATIPSTSSESESLLDCMSSINLAFTLSHPPPNKISYLWISPHRVSRSSIQ